MKIVKIVVFLVVFIILSVIVLEFLPRKKVEIIIPANVSSTQVSKILSEKKLILHPEIFLTFTYLTGSDLKIKPGSYRVSFSLTGLPIIYKIVRGSKGIKITFPEGFTTEQVAERLYENHIISDPIAFLTYVKKNKFDGFLFPETYYFEPGQKVESIVNKMVRQFYLNYKPEFTSRAYELKMSTYQVVVLSSLVEREAKSFEEKRLVAGVFHNRLKKGWKLESCATVRYALGKYKEPLTYKDTKVDSPYNTYKYYGLPVGPICNPGLDSIKAVLFYEPTEAMFFVTKDNNTHEFSSYYSQHLNLQKGKKKK